MLAALTCGCGGNTRSEAPGVGDAGGDATGPVSDAAPIDASNGKDASEAQASPPCIDLANAAAKTFMQAIVADQSCETGSDCVAVAAPLPCASCSEAAVNASSVSEAMTAGAHACMPFFSQGCDTAIIVSCPPNLPAVCEGGLCAVGLPQ
jgi:hypothetical protein